MIAMRAAAAGLSVSSSVRSSSFCTMTRLLRRSISFASTALIGRRSRRACRLGEAATKPKPVTALTTAGTPATSAAMLPSTAGFSAT